MRRGNWPAILVVCATVAVLAVSGYLIATWPPETDVPRETTGTGSSSPSGGEMSMVVLGDSFSAESPASNGPGWPQILCDRLGCTVTTDAADSRGYVRRGNGQPLGARIEAAQERQADVIVVAVGFADLGAHPVGQVVSAAEAAVSRLARDSGDAEVVVLSPFSPGEPGPLTRQLSSALERIADENQVAYVDATGWLPLGQGLVSADGTRPTEKGQRRIADEMQRALTELGIVRRTPAGSPSGQPS